MRLSFLLFLTVVFLYSCNSSTPNPTRLEVEGVTPSEDGSYLKIHNDVEGNVPEIGEISTFRLTQRYDDTIVYQNTETVAIPDLTRMSKKVSPVFALLQQLSAGDSGSVYMPVDSLAKVQEPWQKNKEFLIYDIYVESISNPKVKENEVATSVAEILAAYKAGTLENIVTLENGLKYVVHEEGAGAQAEAGKVVFVDYFGVLASDGSMFDNSFGRGQAYKFPLGGGRVIKGWDVGIAELKKGSKATLFIPSALGYGVAGSPPKIPANAELVFYVEVKDK